MVKKVGSWGRLPGFGVGFHRLQTGQCWVGVPFINLLCLSSKSTLFYPAFSELLELSCIDISLLASSHDVRLCTSKERAQDGYLIVEEGVSSFGSNVLFFEASWWITSFLAYWLCVCVCVLIRALFLFLHILWKNVFAKVFFGEVGPI